MVRYLVWGCLSPEYGVASSHNGSVPSQAVLLWGSILPEGPFSLLKHPCKCFFLPSLLPQEWTAAHLHKGEGRSGAEWFILVLQLVAHVLLHALLHVDPLLLVHAEQGSGGHSNGDCILRLGLQRCRRRAITSTSLRWVSWASPSESWGREKTRPSLC